MEPEGSSSKRKRPGYSTFDKWLQPGRWRGSKKARSASCSQSPPASPPSTSNEASTTEAAQSNSDLRRPANHLSPSREPNLEADVPLVATIPSDATALDSICAPAGIAAPSESPVDTTWSGLEGALQRLHIATEICPPLRSAVGGLTSCLSTFRVAAKNRREYEVLTTGLKSLVEQLISHMHRAPSEDIIDAISPISDVIRREIECISIYQSQSRVRRMASASEDEEDLLRRYRRIEQLFRQLQGEASMSSWIIISRQYINTLLESLHPAKLARFDSILSAGIGRRTCTENTRTAILQGSMIWSEEPSAARVYWMNGMAGTGKTTIACSLCVALEARKQLAASFFCTRTSPECRGAERIVPTIAYQLARRSTPFRSALCKALEEDPDISAGNISSQFDLLLKRPLIRVKDKLPDNLVVVIDALDECSDPLIVGSFLDLLFRSMVNLPIRFFITSRPEPAIRNKMMPESKHSRSILYLHEIEKSIVQADIELYLKEELSFMAPAEHDIQELAERAGNLFIYAATVVRYIRPPGLAVNSQERLAAILAVNLKTRKSLSDLDALYSTILAAAMKNDKLESAEKAHIQLVLWTAICALEPILISTLTTLCRLDNGGSTVAALQSLQSVLHISDHTELVTTLHASFPDYLLTKERSNEFFCDKAAHSRFLAERCFEIMQAQLKFNICSIQSSFIPDEEILGLQERIDANISEELHYTCRFWADHLDHTAPVNGLIPLVDGFLSDRLLFWMEVLNLKKCLVTGVLAITKLNIWLARTHPDTYPDLLKLASGAHIFIASYTSRPISAYTPHIYLSALPLSPPSSPLRSCYLPRFKGLVSISGSLMNKLEGSALGTWKSKYALCSAAFSPNGDLIVLGSTSGEISVQNAYSGKYIVHPYIAHKSVVTSIGISNNGMKIVSGSYDMTLSVWSTQDGSLISGPFKGHVNQVTSVNFSPDTTYIVSGSDDRTVGIWDSYDAATPMRALIGHKKAVKSVAFSPDGMRVASGSDDRSLRLWELSRGTTIFILEGHVGSVVSVQFSPDGAHIISGSYDRTICVWNISDGTLYSRPVQDYPYSITSIAISPEGSRIVSGSVDCTIHVWNKHTGERIAGPFLGHTASIAFVGFSDDGKRIVSASNDKTVRVWNAHGRVQGVNNPLQQAIGITQRGACLALVASPDQTQVATIFESSVDIWDVQTGTLAASIPVEKNDRITFLQFSFDRTRIFTLHASHKICTWDARTAKLVDGPHTCSTNPDQLRPIACSVDGTRVVACYGKTMELWDTTKHQSIAFHTVKIKDDFSNFYPKVKFSLGGRSFATELSLSKTTALYVWDANSGTLVAGPFLGKLVLDISPGGRSMVCYNYMTSEVHSGFLELINLDNGDIISMIGTLYEPRLSKLKFSLDGRHVAWNSSTTCYTWDTRTQAITEIQPTWVDRPESFTYAPDDWCLVHGTLRLGGRGTIFQVGRFHIDRPRRKSIIRSDGWLVDDLSRQLLWLPAEIRDDFPMGNGLSIEGGDGLFVDGTGMLGGDDWSECFIGK